MTQSLDSLPYGLGDCCTSFRRQFKGHGPDNNPLRLRIAASTNHFTDKAILYGYFKLCQVIFSLLTHSERRTRKADIRNSKTLRASLLAKNKPIIIYEVNNTNTFFLFFMGESEFMSYNSSNINS